MAAAVMWLSCFRLQRSLLVVIVANIVQMPSQVLQLLHSVTLCTVNSACLIATLGPVDNWQLV